MKSKYEQFIHNKWRPAIGWSYLIICMFDFMVGPIMFTMIQFIAGAGPTDLQAWQPLTLQAGGLYHLSMMAIVGVTAYGRTREKLKVLADKMGIDLPGDE